MANAPTPYTITAWGQTLDFQVQCSEEWGSGQSGFDQWGVLDNTFYLYVRGGDGIVAAKVVSTPNGTVETVDIWFSVGIINRNGSHCVGQIFAAPHATEGSVFEMSVAGANIGFCGAQLKGNSTFLNVTGSIDMGQCPPTDTVCTSANDISTTYPSCPGTVSQFSLPALGRKAYADYGPSAYPGGSLDTVTLAMTGNDDTFFGPESPTV